MQHFLTTTRSFSQTSQTSVRRHRYFSIFGLAPLLLVWPKEGRTRKQIQKHVSINMSTTWSIIMCLNMPERRKMKYQPHLWGKERFRADLTPFSWVTGDLSLYLPAGWSPWTLSSWNGCMRKSTSSPWSPKQTPWPQRNANSSRNRSAVSPAAHTCTKNSACWAQSKHGQSRLSGVTAVCSVMESFL